MNKIKIHCLPSRYIPCRVLNRPSTTQAVDSKKKPARLRNKYKIICSFLCIYMASLLSNTFSFDALCELNSANLNDNPCYINDIQYVLQRLSCFLYTILRFFVMTIVHWPDTDSCHYHMSTVHREYQNKWTGIMVLITFAILWFSPAINDYFIYCKHRSLTM